MKRIVFSLVIMAALALSGCSTASDTIDVGIYFKNATAGKVTYYITTETTYSATLAAGETSQKIPAKLGAGKYKNLSASVTASIAGNGYAKNFDIAIDSGDDGNYLATVTFDGSSLQIAQQNI